MLDGLLLLWMVAFPLMGSPGPATLSLAGIGTAFGLRAGLPYLAGIIVGTTGVLLLVASGVTALVLAQPLLMRGLAIVAIGYILYLAWKIATAPVATRAIESSGHPSLFPGFVLAIANPKAFAAIGAVYTSNSLIAESLINDAIAKLAALFLVIVIVNTTWLGFGSVFSRLFSHPRLGRLVNVLFAMTLIASAGLALWELQP